MPVGELLSRVSAEELTWWQAFCSIEPFGEYRADIRSAIIACVFANANRGKNRPPYKVDDFMPKFDPPKQMSPEEIKNVLKGLCSGNSR